MKSTRGDKSKGWRKYGERRTKGGGKHGERRVKATRGEKRERAERADKKNETSFWKRRCCINKINLLNTCFLVSQSVKCVPFPPPLTRANCANQNM